MNHERPGMVIRPEFAFGETVYLKASLGEGGDECKGQVVCYTIYPQGEMLYDVVWEDMTRLACYGFQLSRTKYHKEEEDVESDDHSE